MTKKIESLLNKINKKYGSEVITRGLKIKKQWLPTGILNVDWALGGGFAQGGFIELYGQQSSGKSTIALKTIAVAQKKGKVCAYIDVEDAYDSDWAIQNGVDTDALFVMDKDAIISGVKKQGEKGINAEFILQLMIDLISTRGIDILVLDSIACLVPKDELNKEMDEEARVAGVAKLLNRALRVMNNKNRRTATIIFINQLRDNIGTYGGGQTTPGGKAIKFYAFQRVNVKRGKNIVKKDSVIGYNVKVIVEKNKVAIPYRTVEYVAYNDSSIDRFETYWNLAKNINNFGEGISVTGRTYTYKEEVIAKSQDEFRNWLLENEDIFLKLEESLINQVKDVGEKEIDVDIIDRPIEEIAKEIKKETVGTIEEIIEEKNDKTN